MWRNERDRARSIGEYVDGLIVHRRSTHDSLDRVLSDDQELEELRALARALSAIEVVPPADLRDALAQRLGQAATPGEPATRIGRLWRGVAGEAEVPGAAPRRPLAHAASAARAVAIFAGAVLALLIVAPPMGEVPMASAAEILSRSDLALQRLVGPGETLYRRWRSMRDTAQPEGGAPSVIERMVLEWMDGDNVGRVAARWYTADGRLVSAYTRVAERDALRPVVYFAPGTYGESEGGLHIEPTQAELEQALARFPPAERRTLGVFLNRQYLYVPIIGERRFNRVMLEEPGATDPQMPRIRLSADSATVDGVPVYRVRIVDPARVRFNWRQAGLPRVRVAWAEVIRYVARETYLTVKTEETYVFRDGRRDHWLSEPVETRAVPSGSIEPDPFTIDPGAASPVRRHSALELLSAVAEAVGRQAPARGTEP